VTEEVTGKFVFSFGDGNKHNYRPGVGLQQGKVNLVLEAGRTLITYPLPHLGQTEFNYHQIFFESEDGRLWKVRPEGVRNGVVSFRVFD
jgi:hypothetical protein